MNVPGLKFKKDADEKAEYFCKNTDFKSLSRSEIIDNFEWVLEKILDCSTNSNDADNKRYFLVTYVACGGMAGNAFVECFGMFNHDLLVQRLSENKHTGLIITGYQEMSKEDYLVCSKKNN